MTIAKAMKPEEALALLKKYGASDSVIDHVKAVRDYALELADQNDCDRELVEAGSLLHDIGRSRTHNIDHAIVGAAILRREGVEERIVRIAERHVGAGLTREDAESLGLPPGDYIPKTIEEKIVCQADNLIGSKDRISIHEAIATAEEKWTPEGVKRLIQLQYEVFRPVEVSLSGQVCAEERIEEVIGDMDVLYKKTADKGNYKLALFGRDAAKAARRLKKVTIRPPG